METLLLVRSNLFFILDEDDWQFFDPQVSIVYVYHSWLFISQGKRRAAKPLFSGFWGNCIHQSGWYVFSYFQCICHIFMSPKTPQYY